MQRLTVNGRRHRLLPATSLQAVRGRLLLVTGARQDQRTALALTLSGRMKPSGGAVAWDGSPKVNRLRAASAVVDSPGVNEPEQHLSVRDLVAEDLALVPRRHRGALSSGPWLQAHGFGDIADSRAEELDAGRRVELLTALALTNADTDLLVLDSPDRHSGDCADWLPRLEELSSDAGRPLAVVATVSSLPAGWAGHAASIGNAEPEPEARPVQTPPEGNTK